MPENERHVEVGLHLDITDFEQKLEKATQTAGQAQQQIAGSFDPSVALGAAGFSQNVPPSGSSSPAIPGGGFAVSGGAVFLPPQTDPGVAVGAAGMPQMPLPMGGASASAPGAGGGWEQFEGLEDRLKKAWSEGAAQTPPNPNDETKEERSGLVDALRGLRGTVQEDGKKRKDHLTEIFQFDAMMRLGRQVGQDISQGHMFSAVGGGVGGALGLFGGPVGRLVGGGLSAAGGLLDQLMGGTGGARDFEKTITDMNQRFGLGDVGRLRNYRLGEQYGYTGVESAGMIDRLRENRALDNPAQAGPLVNAIQEMTRALGLNAEATIEMAGVYSRTGGEKGAQGVRGYLADVVGGAIRAGFESNIQQYADMMGSARMQAVQTTGQGVSDRAFNLLQDVMGGLTGGNSRTSSLFRDNSQMAAMGMQSFLAMGGTANPYSTSAAYMRLAGINEANLDTRFNTAEQIAQNAQQSLGWTTGRLQEMSGMSAAQFQQNAQNSPNFIQDLLSNSVVMQRQTSHIVSGFLGREATANDLRAYEELTNIAAANGGQLPMDGTSPDASRVNELLEQLQASPADEMRQMEAARHNRVMEVMSHFMDLQTRVDDWMIKIMDWLLTFNLEAVQQAILNAMTMIEDFVKETAPKMGEFLDAGIQFFGEIMPPVLEGISATMAGIDATMAAWRQLFENPIETLTDAGQGALYTAQQGWRWMRGEDLDPNDGQGVPQWRQILGHVTRTTTMGLEPGSHLMGQVGRSLGILPDDQTRVRPGRNENLRPGRGAGTGGIDDSQMVPVHGTHGDTPGTLTATPGYNVFRFAPGDVISARQATVPGGATLTDINLTLNQGMSLGVQQHREAMETAGLLQDVTNKIHELFGKTQSDVENYVAKLFPALMEGQRFHIDRTVAGNAILDAISKSIPGVVAAIDAVKEAIMASAMASAAGMAGGAGGTGQLGAFASGLFTGPRAHIGGSFSNHIDTKIRDDTSWEQIDQYFVAMAEAYAEQNRRIEFSNSRVSGQVFDPNASQEDRIAMLQRAAAAHAPRAGWHSFDYYIPLNGDARSESANSSSAGAEMMLPTLPGGRVEYGSGGRYGNYANLYDENGVLRFRTGHGDDRRALPQGRAFPTAPPPGAGVAGGGGTTQSAIDLIREFEGFHDTPYWDHQQYSWGYGTRAPGAGGRITREQAERELQQHLVGVNRSIDNAVRVPLNPNQRAALQSFIYNVGEGAFEDSTMVRRLNAGDYEGAANEFARWNRASGRVEQGLVRRRAAEADLFRRPWQGEARDPGARASNTTNNINVAVTIPDGANAGVAREAARAGTVAALDEFEQRRQVDSNPRNRTGDRTLSPVYS